MPKFKVINNELRVDKIVTKLDEFALDVISVIQKHTDYVIISGYVSIFFGRSRGTEDIDMFIRRLPYDEFLKMYNEFLEKGYEFNIENPHDLYYDYLADGTSINVWVKDKPLLRMEIKLAKKLTQIDQLNHPIIVHFGEYNIKFSQIESQIAYKRHIAKSEKDMEDARHLEIVFEDLDKERIKYYKQLFLEEFG